jgi:WD40 repeat protein
MSGAKDGSVLVWNIQRSRRARHRITLPAPARGWTFQPDSKAILLGETAGVVSEWSGPDFQQRRVLHDFGTNIARACFTDDGSRIAVEFPNRQALVWDLREARVVAQFALPPGRSNVEDFDARGTHLYLDNYIGEDFHQWDVPSNRLAQTWQVPGPYDVGSAYSSDGRWRIAVNNNGAGIARDLIARTNRSFTVNIIEPDALALSGDGQQFAIASLRGYVQLWEWPSLREFGKLHGFLQGAHSVIFSPDGKRVAAGSNGRQAVKLWDVTTQRELVTLEGDGSIFARLRFSPDGNTIGARNDAGVLHLWRAPSLAAIEAAERK